MIRTISSRVAYQNAWMTVREDAIERADGTAGVYGVIDKPPSALIVPYEHGGFWLVEQFRYPIGARSWEFPQGTLPDRADTDPESLARMELGQETGLRAGSVARLGWLFHAVGMSSQGCNLFLATDLSRDPDAPPPDPEEDDLVTKWFPRAEVEAMIRQDRVSDGATLAAYAYLLLKRPAAAYDGDRA